MEGVDESTELRRHPLFYFPIITLSKFSTIFQFSERINQQQQCCYTSNKDRNYEISKMEGRRLEAVNR